MTAEPASAQYAVASNESPAGWKPFAGAPAGCGSRRTTSQSSAGAPVHAPAGTVMVASSLEERSAVAAAANEFFST